MSFRLSSTGCCLALIFFGGADVVLNTACAQGVSHPKRAIEFSETNNTEVLSKLNQLNNESETARGLQDEWKPWNSGSIDDRASRAPGAQYAPPSSARIPTRRLKDLLERRKSWTSDDLLPGNSAGDWWQSSTFGEDGKDKNKSSIKQFSETLTGHDKPRSKQSFEKDDDQRDSQKHLGLNPDLTSLDDPTVPGGIRDATRKLTERLGNTSTKNGFGRAPLDDFFGLSSQTLSRDQADEQKAYIDKYRTDVLRGQSVFSPQGSPSNPLLNPLAPADPLSRPAYLGGLESVSSPTKSDNSPQMSGALGSILIPTAVPDLNAKALNQWNPFFTPPKLEPAKLPPLSVAVPDFPRRRF